MPINPLLDNNIDKDRANTTTSGGNPAGTQISSGLGSSVTGAVSGQGAQNSAPSSGGGSGSFTNLNQYIEANKDQSAGLGSKIQQGIQKDVNTGLSQLGSSEQEYKTAQDQASVNPNDYTAQAVTQKVQGALSNPSQVSQTDAQAFQDAQTKATNLATGKDTAPKTLDSLNSYQNALGTLNQAQSNAQLTGTEAGRQQLLQQTFSRPTYTKGQSSLDQLLVQNVPENRQRFEDLRNNLLGQYGLGSQETQAIQNAADYRTQQTKNAQGAAQNIQNVLYGPTDTTQTAPTGAQYGILTGLENQYQALPGQLNAQQAANLTAAQQQAKSYLSTINTLGASQGDIQNAINSAITAGSQGQASLANSLTPNQIAQLNALNTLAGRDQNTLGKDVLTFDQNQFNPNETYNRAPIDAAIQQRMAQVRSDIGSLNVPQQNISVEGKNLGLADATNYVVQRALSGAYDPSGDVSARFNPLIDQFNANILPKMNQMYKQYGLPPTNIQQMVSTQDIQRANQDYVTFGQSRGIGGFRVDPNNPHDVEAIQKLAQIYAIQDIIKRNSNLASNSTNLETYADQPVDQRPVVISGNPGQGSNGSNTRLFT